MLLPILIVESVHDMTTKQWVISLKRFLKLSSRLLSKLQQLFCHKITKLGCFILFHGTDKNNAVVKTDKGFAAAHLLLQSYRRGLEPTIIINNNKVTVHCNKASFCWLVLNNLKVWAKIK